eukprot:11190839-Lingulodinium_polyedra.AAC.1
MNNPSTQSATSGSRKLHWQFRHPAQAKEVRAGGKRLAVAADHHGVAEPGPGVQPLGGWEGHAQAL